jgi:hypothetical protein
MRRLSLRYPPRIRAANRTKETYYITAKNGNQVKRVKFTCEQCGKKDLKAKEKQLDHINPVVDVKEGFTTYEEYFDRLLCEESNWATLCLDCHAKKTLKENEERRK